MWLQSSKNAALAIKKKNSIVMLTSKTVLLATKDCAIVLPRIKLPQADYCRTFPSQESHFFSPTPIGTTPDSIILL